MKVFILAILLVSVCCLQGAVVKRQAEEQAPVAAPGSDRILESFHQAVARYIPQDLLEQSKFTELGAQAQEHLQQLQERMASLTGQLAEGFNQFLTRLKEFSKKPTQ